MKAKTADRSRIRLMAEKAGIPLTDAVLKALKRGADHGGRRVTILAACPNSEAVTRAAIRAAKGADAPIKFAATLNQVDLDGGYTRWTQNHSTPTTWQVSRAARSHKNTGRSNTPRSAAWHVVSESLRDTSRAAARQPSPNH